MAKKRVFPPEFGAYFAKIGKKGGNARLTTMTPEQRSAIAKKASLAAAEKRSQAAAERRAKERK